MQPFFYLKHLSAGRAEFWMKAEELADWDVANIWFGKLIEKNVLPMYF